MNNQLLERNGAVAFLDILGFKGIWTRQSPIQVIQITKEIVSQLLESTKEVCNEKEHYRHLDVTIISDTIIIEFEGKSYKTLIFIAEVIQRIFFPFLIRKLPLRGAVTFGQYFRDENTFVGPAVDDVAEWYEQANWIGVMLTPSATIRLESGYCDLKLEDRQRTLNKFWIKYPIPCKSLTPKKDKITLYALNWPSYVKHVTEDLNSEIEKSTYSIILQILSEQGNVEPSIFDKYDNTICFVKKCLEIENVQND